MDGFFETVQDTKVGPVMWEPQNLFVMEGQFSPVSRLQVSCYKNDAFDPRLQVFFPMSVGELTEIFDEVYVFVIDADNNILHQGQVSGEELHDPSVVSLTQEKLKRIRG